MHIYSYNDLKFTLKHLKLKEHQAKVIKNKRSNMVRSVLSV
jgi:hypothetical protein